MSWVAVPLFLAVSLLPQSGPELIAELRSTDAEDHDRIEALQGDLLLRFEELLARLDEGTLGGYAFELYELADGLARLPGDLKPLDEPASELMRLALEAARLLGRPEMVADCELWIGVFLQLEGHFRQAREELHDAYGRSRKVAPGTSIKLLAELGAAARATVDFGLASESLWSALAATDELERTDPRLCERLLFLEHRAMLYGELGRLQQRLGNIDRAGHWFELERQTAQGTEDRATHVTARLNRIRFAFARRDHGEVERQVADLRRVYGAESHRADVEVYLRESGLRLVCDREEANETSEVEVKTALGRLRDALEDPELGPSVGLWPSLRTAHLCIERGLLADAQPFLERARIEHGRLIRDSTELHARYEALFLDAVASCLARAENEPVEDLARRLERFEANYEAFLTVWNETPIRPGGIGFLWYDYPGSSQSVGELLDLVIAVDEDGRGVERAFELLLRCQALGSLARGWGLGSPGLAEVQRELIGEDELLLVYFPSPHRSHLFLVDREGVRHETLAPRRALQQARDDLASALFRRPTNLAFARRQAEAQARELARLLLPPSASSALSKVGKLTVVGADLLGETPFEWFAGEEGAPLGFTHAIAYLPSVPVGLELVRRHGQADTEPERDLVLLGSPDHGEEARATFPGLRPLSLSDAELSSVWRGLDDDRVHVATADRASFAFLRSESVPSARTLQILAHGAHDPARERPAVLLVAPSPGLPDGLLRYEQAAALRSPPVVVLSACGSGRGPLRRGEDGVSDFGGAFLEAGARVVLLSPADLDARATFELSGHFHRQLAAGASPAEALRRARVAVQAVKGWDHPYFHSALRALGIGHRRF